MGLIYVQLKQQYLGSRCDNVFAYGQQEFGGFYVPSIAALNTIRDFFIDEILVGMNEFQNQEVQNGTVTVYAPYRGVSVSALPGGVGQRGAAATQLPKKSLAFALRLFVGNSKEPNTFIDLADQTHRIQRGYKYIPGVLDDDMSMGSLDVTAFLEAHDAAFRGSMLETIPNPDHPGSPWEPIVFGKDLNAVGTPGTPGYKPPRIACMAIIEASAWTGVSNLRKRQR